MDAPKMTKAQQKQAGIDLLRTLRLNIEALGVPSDKARSAIYDALTVTADGILPGGQIEATIAVNAALAWLNEPDTQEPTLPDVGPLVPATPHSGPILYLPATCGWFNGGEDMGAILRWLATYRGRVGLNFEATGSTGNQGVRTMDWKGAYQAHCSWIPKAVYDCAVAGIPVNVVGINSNDFGKGWAASWNDTPENRRAVLSIMGELARDLCDLRESVIVNPVSEDDTSMPAALRKACFDLWPAAGWPRNRLCGVGIAETHTGELKALKPPALASTDKGEAIEKHFGRGVWTAHTPNVQRCSEYARHYLSRGVHCSLYHRADRLHLLEHRAAYDQIIKAAGISAATGGGTDSPDAPAVPPTASPGAASFDWSKVRFKGANVSQWAETVRLSDVTIADKITLHTNKADWEHWQAVLERVKVNANAWIIRPDGDGWLAETWEWMRPGQQTKERKNLLPLKLVPGQVYGWMISGLARDRRRNVSERSNVVWRAWT